MIDPPPPYSSTFEALDRYKRTAIENGPFHDELFLCRGFSTNHRTQLETLASDRTKKNIKEKLISPNVSFIM